MLLMTLFIALTNIPASGFTVSKFKSSTSINYSDPTHVFVIGYAGGLSDQFFRTAVGKAQRYRELYPQHQIVVIGPDKIDTKSRYLNSYSSYRKRLKRLDLNLVRLNEKWLTSHRLIPILDKFQRIKSLEFFSHSAAHKGVGLDDIDSTSPLYRYKRFNEKTPGLTKLKDNLTEDSYIMLHGCNSGFLTAPALAKILGVPAAGSLSSTNFQEPFSDGNWYFNDSGRYPSDLHRLSANPDSYSKSNGSCRQGLCSRLRPEQSPYTGYWGRLNAGLSHYKFFCGQKKAGSRCKRAMAKAFMAQIGILPLDTTSTVEAFKSALREFLCPDASRPEAQKNCQSALRRAEMDSRVTAHGMRRGKVLNCSFEKCDLKLRCGEESGSCKILSAAKNPRPQTMVREYLAYIEGFQLLTRP